MKRSPFQTSDSLLKKALLVAATVETALRKSNFDNTAKGLKDLANLLVTIRKGYVKSSDNSPEQWRLLRNSIASARKMTADLLDALDAMDRATRARRSRRDKD